MEIPLWFSNLVFWSVQVALLVLAAALLSRGLKLRQPRVLLAYWRSLLAIGLLLPLIEPWHRPADVATPVLSADYLAVPPPSIPAPSRWHLPSLQTMAPILGMVILAGVVLRLAALALGLLKLRRLRQASSPIPPSSESAGILQAMRDLVAARAEFRLSTQVDSPVTFGLVTPVILLPERCPSLDPRFQSAIACHELLHVRRRDWTHHLGEEILRALFWFHPAVAWLISRVRLTREQIVDLEVVRLTEARKPYLEALLEFTEGRASLAAIPAPPFLAERQLIERIALMLKEVRMSQKRLVASLTVIPCCLALVIALAARAFPLKAAPRPAPPALRSGDQPNLAGSVAQGISRGIAGEISKGIVEGVSGGISGRIATPAQEPNVDIAAIWTDKVKRGPMLRQVRGLGALSLAKGSQNAVIKVALPAVLVTDVRPNKDATVDTHLGLVKGHVANIDQSSSGETRTVNIVLDGPLPQGFSAGRGAGDVVEVVATIDIEKLDKVLYVGRPVNGSANSSVDLFKIIDNGAEAVRTHVKLGRSSVNTIEVLDGLQEGDRVIISDMSSVANAERIRVADEKHLRSH